MTAEPYATRDYDVVVVGAGGAGLRAAIEASAQGAKTAIICKSLLGKASTVMALGGIAAAMGNVHPQDGWRAHFRDTVRAGRFMSHWRMGEIHAREAPERVLELLSWGALFDRTADGRIAQRRFGGHRHARLAYRADRTGQELLRALQQRATHEGIDIHMECSVQRLLLDDGRIAGALACRRTDGELVLFRCKALILATGGGGRAWKFTSNPCESTGDGVALALAAGAELMDMEFVQFHPTGMLWPPGARGRLVSESVRAEGATLRNAAGKRFMFDYVKDRPETGLPPELLPPDEVARAIDVEVRAGRGTAHGGVLLELASRECIEVGPTCHYALGGVRVDADTTASTVPGLFAAGEVAAGLHGASRIGGNALSELLVFGRRAGLHAAQYCSASRPRAIDRRELERNARKVLAPLERRSGENPYTLQGELQECMHNLAGVTRSGDGLRRALCKIGELKDRLAFVSAAASRHYNPGWHLALDLHSLLSASEATVRAAIERKESRGSHARNDFPAPDAAYGAVNFILRRSDAGLQIQAAPAVEMPEAFKRLVDWSKEWLAKKPRSESGAATPTAASSRIIG
jgi:succinate dehydrogenase flavoprotein subunit